MKTRIAVVLVLFGLCIPTALSAATKAIVMVTATVQPAESSISIDTSLISFGAVTGSEKNRRFVTGPVKVGYFAGASAWTVRVYTANRDGINGLIGVSDHNTNIPIKVWCDNYGPRLN
ncbi:MAG: hypothetical protein NTV07_02525, partial [Candidatus Omnitrophica bacterium]|nr:hypothetical protein [Candidatus Omnitrophota bacterium]